MSWRLWLERLADSVRGTRESRRGAPRRRRTPFGPRSLYGERLALDHLEDRTLLSPTVPLPPGVQTALDAYVSAPDPAYHYSLNSTLTGQGYTDYVINMTSQTWRSPSEVNQTAWQHWLQIIVPATVTSHTAVLEIGGGSNTLIPPPAADNTGVLTATTLGAITVVLPTVPNEPLQFTGQPGPFTEDQIVAYSLSQYLNGGDQNWPVLLPMVESAVRAMDTTQSFVASQSGGSLSVDNFVVSGASKRGWTTWLTPAVDSRVVAIVPFVFDFLNEGQQVPHLQDAYVGVTQDVVGGFPGAVKDYTNDNVFGRLGTPQGIALGQIIDPFSYINRPGYDIPKYMVDSTGDQFFVPDSAQYYFNQLPGQNYIRYVPNTDHGLNADAVTGALNFMKAFLDGAQLPQFSWNVTDGGTTIDVHSVDTPTSVEMWQASDPNSRDFRLESIGAAWSSSNLSDQGGGNYVAHVTLPASWAKGFFVQMTYQVDGVTLTFTTQVSVVPLFTPSVVAADPGGTYNGQPYAASATATGISGNPVFGSIAYAYYNGPTATGQSSATPPTGAGTYTVVASFTSQDSSYVNGQSQPVTFTISPATPTVVASDAGGNYTGKPFVASATAKGVGNAAVTGSFAFTYYTGSTATGTGTSVAPTIAGTYTVVASFTSSDSNYGNATSAPVTFTIQSVSWNGYAGNAQHTALSPTAAQALQAIHWQTPVDLDPQHSGGTPDGELFIHYGSPVITGNNTVIVPVKTGATNGFQLEAFNGATGAVKWTVSTDYLLPQQFNWTPEYGPVLSGDRLYFPGAGGTLFYVNNLDATGPHAATRVAFYGTGVYNADPTDFNNSIYIDTPLNADANGDVFFGYRVYGSNPAGVQSGIARVDAGGNGTFTSALAASGNDSNIAQVPHNATPGLSADGSTLYVSVVASFSQFYGYLVALDSTTLQLKTNSTGGMEREFLQDPRNGNNAGLLDDSSAAPMVAPDGTVFYGTFANPFNGSRGFMLHFSGDLSTEYTPGAFGWDDTASIVPASMVPSYHGTSSYLIMTKYNNYTSAEVGPSGGDGVNLIAVLDPYATQADTRNDGDPNLQVMREVLTIAGPTPDTQFLGQTPNAVREWCINTAVVDPGTDSVYANSEDGNLYRWNLATNTLSQVVNLTPGLGEAYTPTMIGPDGTVYAINDATLFAVGRGPAVPAPISLTATGLNFGSQAAGTTSPAPRITRAVVPGTNVKFVAVAASGPDAADFTFGGPQAGSVVQTGQAFGFTFTPSHLGAESATFTIQTNQGLVTVNLSGTGTSPVRQTGGTVGFGNQTVGVVSPVRSTTLVNLGAGINLLAIAASGPNAADFTLVNPPALGPLAQGTQVLNFTFTPSATGSETATYTLQTSAGSVTINLSGSGVVNAKQPAVQLSGTSIQFGNQLLGQSSSVVTQTLTITGNVQLQSITETGANPNDFTFVNPPVTGTLPPGSQVLQFFARPSKLGSENATFTLHTSAGNFAVSLSANGTTPLFLSSNGVNFGSVGLTAGTSQFLTLYYEDLGGSDQVLSISSTSPDAADFPIISAPNGELTFGQNRVDFGFNPSRLGNETATYVIQTTLGSFNVTLNGKGIAPVSLSTGRIDLGSVPVGTTTLQETAYLFNLGANVTLQSVTISGTNAADFTLSNANSLPIGQLLPQGQSLPLEFTFSPSKTATESATVTVVTSVGTLTLQLSGVGLVASI
jgi:PhoPQ-activated pathogenicity-related protein